MTFDPKKHLTNLKGKSYLETRWRLVWFRDEHPRGKVTTELLSTDPLIVRAQILTAEGEVLATGHGSALAKAGAVWSGRELEKAETAAIGRALGHAGYGTQFSEDEDERSHLADSPVERRNTRPPQPPPSSGGTNSTPVPKAPQPSPAPTPPPPSSSASSASANAGLRELPRIEVDGDPADAIDQLFGKRETGTIVVSEVRVIKQNGKQWLQFEQGGVKVTSFTRDPLRGVLDDSIVERLSAPGRYDVPPVKVWYTSDNKDFPKVDKVERVA